MTPFELTFYQLSTVCGNGDRVEDYGKNGGIGAGVGAAGAVVAARTVMPAAGFATSLTTGPTLVFEAGKALTISPILGSRVIAAGLFIGAGVAVLGTYLDWW